jgi:spore maturation protein CgeB
VRELAKRGHDVLFLERDAPWYAKNRDLAKPPYGTTKLYRCLSCLEKHYKSAVRDADAVIVGSYVPEGVEVGKWVQETARGVKAFYDIDTPVTLAKLEREDYEYLSPELIPGYDLYLSFTGGPTLQVLEKEYGSPKAIELYCSFDPELYFPEEQEIQWDLGYMGTYSEDRQPPLEELLVNPASAWKDGRFVVAGPMYPKTVKWPKNVERVEHLPPQDHRLFYNSQRFTLNITRQDMIRAGYSPSVRLFEAAACGTPIISDYWDGLDTIFEIGREILVARDSDDVSRVLKDTSEAERKKLGERARQRALTEHTAAHRAEQLEGYILKARKTAEVLA